MSVKSDHAERWDYMQELLKKAPPKKKGVDIKRKYILRCDNDKRHEHYYRVEIRANGIRHKKCFPDKKCGGKSSAMLAAISWRNEKIKEVGFLHLRGVNQQPYRKGKRGYWLRKKKIKNKIYEFVVAGWRESKNGKRVTKVKEYSVNKYGLKKAIRLAKKYREEKLKELYG